MIYNWDILNNKSNPWSTISKREWNDFIETNDGSVYHSSDWMDFINIEFSNMQPFHIVHFDKFGNINCVLPLFLTNSIISGRRLISSPFSYFCGPLYGHDADISLMTSIIYKIKNICNASHIQIRSLKKESMLFNNGFNISTPYITSIIELKRTNNQQLWSSFSKGRKTDIKRGLTSNLELIEEMNPQRFDDLYKLYQINKKKLGIPFFSKNLFKSIISKPIIMSTKNFLVYDKNDLIAAISLILFRKRAIVWQSLVNLTSINKSKKPIPLAYWRAINWAIENHFDIFDFGTSSPNSSLSSFKQHWGATEFPVYYHCVGKGQFLDPTSRNLAYIRKIWGFLPLPLLRLVGPHVINHLE